MTDASPSVFITGCSSGFGLGLAVELARRGWQVLPSMRDPGKRAALDRAWTEADLAAARTLSPSTCARLTRCVRPPGP